MRSLVAVALLLACPPTLAASIVVNSDSAGNNVMGVCTLRDAITSANSDTAVGGCVAGNGSDTISLPIAAYIKLADPDNLTNGPNGLPVVSSTIVIDGNGATLDRDWTVGGAPGAPPTPLFRFFMITSPGNLSLNHLTMNNGCGCGQGDADINREGGAIYNGNQLALQDVAIRHSLAAGFGGAIYNDGDLTVDRTIFDSNTTYKNGGAIADSANGHNATITHSLFENNITISSPNRGQGGAIYHDTGTLTLRNDTFWQNDAYQGSALQLNTGPSLISNVTFSDNHAYEDGGSISSASAGTAVAKISNSIITAGWATCVMHAGYMQAVGSNLSSDANCPGFTLSNTNAKLGTSPPTPGYFALPASSPAVDAAVSCLDASGIPVLDDQRGRPRPYGGACDLGAYERDDVLLTNGFEP